MNWTVVYTKQAQKDAKKIASSNLKSQTQKLLEVLAKNPFQTPPPYEKLVGDLDGAYSQGESTSSIASSIRCMKLSMR